MEYDPNLANRLDREARDRDEARENEEAKKNRGFTQVYPKGWKRLATLLEKSPKLARFYVFLAEHVDDSGSVTAGQAVLAECLGVTEKTIQRWSKQLEEMNALVRIRVSNGAYAYALSPDEIWKSWDNKKEYAAFNSRTLVKKSDKANMMIKRRLSVMLREQRGEPELPFEDSE